MNRWQAKFLILSVAVFTFGCSKATPTFQTLDQSVIPRPMFAGSTVKEIVSLTDSQPYAISGQCDPRITALTAVADGVTPPITLQNMVTGSVTLNCSSNGTFSFTLKDLVTLGFNPIDQHMYVIELRAITSGGVSDPSLIKIDFSSTGATGPKRVLITSGGTASTAGQPRLSKSTNFSASIRVDHLANSDLTTVVKTSTNFKMKSGAAAESD